MAANDSYLEKAKAYMAEMEQARFAGNDLARPAYRGAFHGQGGGQLNPRFVEWLQGLPNGWVSLDPLLPEAWQRWLQGLTGLMVNGLASQG